MQHLTTLDMGKYGVNEIKRSGNLPTTHNHIHTQLLFLIGALSVDRVGYKMVDKVGLFPVHELLARLCSRRGVRRILANSDINS